MNIFKSLFLTIGIFLATLSYTPTARADLALLASKLSLGASLVTWGYRCIDFYTTAEY